MPSTVMIDTITLGSEPVALGGDVVFTGDITCPPSNKGAMMFSAATGSNFWNPGEFHPFVRIRLSDIIVSGMPGDSVSLNGGNW